jgi:UDP-glucose 4-epimerase
VKHSFIPGVKTVLLTQLNVVAGSHTVLQLLDNGYDVVIMDNLRNSFPKAFEHMQRIAGDKAARMKFVKVWHSESISDSSSTSTSSSWR